MINYSKNENVNVSVGFRVCIRYCDLKSIWGVAIHPRIVEIYQLSTHTTIHDSTSEDDACDSPVQDVTSLPKKEPHWGLEKD
jgi:hypothetical protein